jgi:proteasome accessory factor A
LYAPLFGLETEYALAAETTSEVRADRANVLTALIDVARAQMVHLFDGRGAGLFVENGSRFYVDAGSHPEWCTPECLHPAEVVRYTKAGESWLARLLELTVARLGLERASLFRANVDYLSGNTWGCHESYLHRATPDLLAPHLIPQFASRVIYTGAGGFERGRSGVHFTLSPRSGFIEHAISDASTGERGLYHMKDESLSRGYRRLHVICGESLCSERAGFLKIGTTALIVRLIELGELPGDGVAPQQPVHALHHFARDPSGRAQVAAENGMHLRAIDIQRHYLAAVEARLGDPAFPEWAPLVCSIWRRTLDALDAGPAAVATSLDWGIKLACFRSFAERHDVRWVDLGRVVGPLGAPNAALAKLFELDMRFGELGTRSIFAALDASGALSHHIAEVGDIDAALREPPPGRARARGLAIRQLAAAPDRYACDWYAIVDAGGRRVVDLTDPFANEAPVRDPARETPEWDPLWDDPDQLDLDFETLDMALRRRRGRSG